MKKLVITLSIVLIGLLGYSQVTSVGEFRVANATTAFGVNLPVGTKVYNIATGDYWVATAGVVSTATLSDATASFAKLNDSGTDDQTAAEVNISDAGEYYTGTTVESALQEVGFSIAAHATSISTNADAISANATNIATNAADIIDNTTNISTNSEGITANAGNITLNTNNITALENLTSKTDNFEINADDLNGSDYALSETAITQYGIQLSINGVITTNFSFAANTVTLSVPVYKYDLIVAKYIF